MLTLAMPLCFRCFGPDRAGRRALNVDALRDVLAVEISNPALNSPRLAFALIAEISHHMDELGCRDHTPPFYVDHRAACDKPRRAWGRRFAGICTGASNGRSPVSTDGDLVEAPNSRIKAQCVVSRGIIRHGNAQRASNKPSKLAGIVVEPLAVLPGETNDVTVVRGNVERDRKLTGPSHADSVPKIPLSEIRARRLKSVLSAWLGLGSHADLRQLPRPAPMIAVPSLQS